MSRELDHSYAVILAGGQGTRLWPLSRASRPKQLLPIIGDDSLLVQTVASLGRACPAGAHLHRHRSGACRRGSHAAPCAARRQHLGRAAAPEYGRGGCLCNGGHRGPRSPGDGRLAPFRPRYPTGPTSSGASLRTATAGGAARRVPLDRRHPPPRPSDRIRLYPPRAARVQRGRGYRLRGGAVCRKA